MVSCRKPQSLLCFSRGHDTMAPEVMVMLNTTLCYIEQDGKYLMLHRVKKKNDITQDKWIGIGGKFEPLESPEDCLLREAREETGLTLTRWRYRGIVTFVADKDPQFMHLYTADGFEGQIKTCDEGNLEWIDKHKLLELPIWEGDKIFLRLLEEDAPFFSLKLVYEGDTLTEAVLDGRPIGAACDPSGGIAATSPCAGEALVRSHAKEPLLISACLMGAACRYDGGRNTGNGLEQLMARYHLIPVCAEQLGGLPTPRTPAERLGDRVITADGRDVTAEFERGAAEVLRLAKQFGCRKALLKERSPSCGHGRIYDGSFTGRKIPGSGVTAEVLTRHGIQVYGESQWEALL